MSLELSNQLAGSSPKGCLSPEIVDEYLTLGMGLESLIAFWALEPGKVQELLCSLYEGRWLSALSFKALF